MTVTYMYDPKCLTKSVMPCRLLTYCQAFRYLYALEEIVKTNPDRLDIKKRPCFAKMNHDT